MIKNGYNKIEGVLISDNVYLFISMVLFYD